MKTCLLNLQNTIPTSRLLASGCSYTDYYWSTWADILGAEFRKYAQVGYGGADNATIARSIVRNAIAGDTVVIMWSSFDRWSFYIENGYPMPKDENNHWRHLGSLAVWDKNFFVNYYHPVERFQATMDYIELVDLHSKVNNYTVYHFSAFPFFKAETESKVDLRLVNIYNNYDIRNNYLTSELSLREFCDSYYNILVDGSDNHPTPLCHWDYVEKVIAPKLKINLTQERKTQIVIEQQVVLSSRS